ncbi:MAG: TonB family protein [Synechococcus sp.]|nr:TonB family protein [Synechococcus sp.]
MLISTLCQEKRALEQVKARRWLLWGTCCSVLLHAVGLYSLRWLPEPPSQVAQNINEPIEFLVMEAVTTPALESEVSKASSDNLESTVSATTMPNQPHTVPVAAVVQTAIPAPRVTTPQPETSPEPDAASDPGTSESEPETPTVENKPAPPGRSPENLRPLRSQLQATASGINRHITANNNSSTGANRSRPTNPGTAPRPQEQTSENPGLNALRNGLQGNDLQNNPNNRNVPANPTGAQRSTPNRPVNNPPAAPVASGAGCSAPSQPKFPASLASRGIEARPVVEVITSTDGGVTQARIVQSSNYAALDQTALSAARGIRCPSGEQRRVRLAINFAQPGTNFQREAQQRQAEAEQQRQAELARQQQAAEAQQRAQQEQQRQAELEQQRQAEAERERQAALEQQRQAELERQRQVDLERQQQQQQQIAPAEVGG